MWWRFLKTGKNSCHLWGLYELMNPGWLLSKALVGLHLPWVSLCPVCVYMCVSLTLWDPVDCGLSNSSVHGISQAQILECVAILFPSQLGDWTWVSCTAGIFFTVWAPREAPVPTTPPQIHTLCPILGLVLDFLPEVFPPAPLGNQHFGEFLIARNCPKDLENKHFFSIFVSRGLMNFLFRMFVHPWFLETVSSTLMTRGSHENIGSDSVKLEGSQHFSQFPGDAGSAGPRTMLRVQVSAENPG